MKSFPIIVISMLIFSCSFGQIGYLNQTKKYIINNFNGAKISKYTDTSVCVEGKPVESCFYFNRDGVCYCYTMVIDEGLMQSLHELLLSANFEFSAKIPGIIRYYNNIMYVDVGESTTKGLYYCYFHY